VPFAHFSEAVPDNQGPALIVRAAKDAGVRMMTGVVEGESVVADLTQQEATEVAPEVFFHPIAYGQYPITVLDHASGLATIAARGVYHEPHFVKSVEQKINGQWQPVEGDRINGEQRVEQPIADAITGVLSTIPSAWGFPLANGRQAAAKTGTWEYDNPQHPEKTGNNDAWVVGYTPQIASAVWVGDSTGKDPIKDQFGGDIGSTGLPAQIWQQFMDDAHAAKEFELLTFPPAPLVGNDQHEYANGEQPRPERPDRDDPRCRLPFVNCDDEDDDDDDDGDNGGGNDDDDDGDVIVFPTELPAPPDP
jgi:membrane peptidoglycan carboxypeptidase